jgi:hypothetical protein
MSPVHQRTRHVNNLSIFDLRPVGFFEVVYCSLQTFAKGRGPIVNAWVSISTFSVAERVFGALDVMGDFFGNRRHIINVIPILGDVNV